MCEKACTPYLWGEWVDMKIRQMAADEIGSIKGLWEMLNSHHLLRSTVFKEHYSKFTFEKRMDGLKKRDRLAAFVAEENGRSVGYSVATVDGRLGEIDSLFVEEAHRGKGMGEKLVSLALAWLEKQECEAIRVSIARGNEDVLDFYRRFGFAERAVVMQKIRGRKRPRRTGKKGGSVHG